MTGNLVMQLNPEITITVTASGAVTIDGDHDAPVPVIELVAIIQDVHGWLSR